MLYTGHNIRASHTEVLLPTPLERLFQQIKSPTPALQNQIERLRTLRQLDERKYQQSKISLPFFIGASFADGLRHSARFTHLHYFVLDFDKLSPRGFTLDQVRQKLQADERVALLFTSPGGDGLKALFRLAEALSDTQRFSHFYRAFALQFCRQHGLEGLADRSTCDVTRVCFLSADPEAWFNPLEEPVHWPAYLSLPAASEEAALEEPSEAADPGGPEEEAAAEPERPLTDEIYRQIRLKLRPGSYTRPAKQYYVPEELEGLEPAVREAAGEHGLELAEVRPISYGKKLEFRFRHDFAELNVFYGKNGFSVVKSPKRGHHPTLTDLAHDLVCQVVYAPRTIPPASALTAEAPEAGSSPDPESPFVEEGRVVPLWRVG